MIMQIKDYEVLVDDEDYDMKAVELLGEAAHLNFPKEVV